MKTDFQRVNPTWEQIKNTRHIIQNMSDIFLKYLRHIFSASENPFEIRGKKRTKKTA